MSRQSPDVLTNCGNTGPITMIGGGCFQQFDTSSFSRSLWVNTTRVVDTQTDPGVWTSAGIPPYQRIYTPQDMCFGDPVTCPSSNDCDIETAGGPGQGTQCDLP